jgi:hypothetical protein
MEMDFKFEYTQKKNSPLYLFNYPQNALNWEAGWRRAFSETMRKRPWWGMVVSWERSSQLRNPRAEYVLPLNGCEKTKIVNGQEVPDCGTAPFNPELARSSRHAAKIGLRWEDRSSWLELGSFVGALNRQTQFQPMFSGQALTGRRTACITPDYNPGQNPETLAKCLENFYVPLPDDLTARGRVKDLDLTRPGREWNADSGVFLNANLRLNRLLPKKLVDEIFVENRGRFHFHHSGNLISDPRLYNKLSFGPVFTFSKGLSLKPTLTYIWYRSKLLDVEFRAFAPTINIEYRFDRHTGTDWRRALRYGRQAR